jgi:opacity protein-like surface antigen
MNRTAAAVLAGAALLSCASAAFAADLIIETAPAAASTADVTHGQWDGPFVGVFGGYAAGSATSPIDFDLNGYLLGLNAGTNFTLSNGIVAGIVGDIAWSNIIDDDVFLRPGAFDVDWTGSIRGRVGYDAGSFMPYVTAGLALARGTLTATAGTKVDSNTHIGWTAGAGLEFKATDNMSLDVAYRYTDYGAASYGVTDWEFSTHQVTAGVNFHF